MVGVMVSLVLCLAASGAASRTIAGASGVAASITTALSFYALFVFWLNLTQGLRLARPILVRFWHAIVVVCISAASSWIMMLPHVAHSIKTVTAFCASCLLAGLIAGPWHGLLPVSRPEQTAAGVGKQGRSNDE